MQDIYDQIKKGVQPKHPSYSCVLFDTDHVFVCDGDVTARIPYESGVDFMVNADLLGKALKSTKCDKPVGHQDALLMVFEKGKRRVELQTVPSLTWAKQGIFTDNQIDDVEWKEVGPDFIPKLLSCSKAMANDEAGRDWMMSVTMFDKCMVATDAKTMFIQDVEYEDEVAIPVAIIEFADSVKDKANVVAYYASEKHVAFKYDTGLVVSCQQSAVARPDQFRRLISFWKDPSLVVTEELRDALLSACEIGEYVVVVSNGKVKARQTAAEFEEEVETGVPEGTSWQYDVSKIKLLLTRAVRLEFGEPMFLVLDDGTRVLQAQRKEAAV